MENLLDVFDSITITNVDRISAEDKAYCENLQKLFDKSMDQVLNWYAFFKKKQDEDTEHLFRIDDGDIRPDFPSDFTKWKTRKDLIFGKYEYSPLTGLVDCVYKAGCLCQELEERTVDYFNGAYGVSLKSENRFPSMFFGEPVERFDNYKYFYRSSPYQGGPRSTITALPEEVHVPRYETVIDYIVEQLGGQSFTERKVMERERNIADDWGYKDISLRGKTVTIGWCAPVETWLHDKPELSYNFDSAFGRVMDAIALAEKSALIPGYRGVDRTDDFGKVIPILGSVTAVSFKFFKNRNLTVTFISEEAAKTFHDTVMNIMERHKKR